MSSSSCFIPVRSEILVDCENCDPLKFFAVLQSLSPEAIGKIQKIFLFDDVNASSIWGLVEHYTKAKVDRFMTQRVVEGKSVVDMTVAVCCCQEHYDKKIDSFLLFSSDSDYWPLINNVVTARFLMMFEREKTSKAIVNKMREHHVLYCYTDQFCKAGDAYRLRNDALALECASYLKQQLGSCNIEEMWRMMSLELCNNTPSMPGMLCFCIQGDEGQAFAYRCGFYGKEVPPS